MSERHMPPIWWVPSECVVVSFDDLHVEHLDDNYDLPADAYRLVPAVIDEAALARAADEVHARVCSCGDRVGHNAEGGFADYVGEDARLYVEAYLRALGGGDDA